MDNKFNLRDYYDLRQSVTRDPNYIDSLVDNFLNSPLRLVFWDDQISEFGDVKKETVVKNNDDGTQLVRHERFDGVEFQAGTPVDASNLGNMEWNDLINWLNIKYLMDTVRKLSIKVATLEGGLSNNMPYNSFVADAKKINEDLIIIEGWYDGVAGRGVV